MKNLLILLTGALLMLGSASANDVKYKYNTPSGHSSAPPAAHAPSVSSYSQDLCRVGSSTGISTPFGGVASGEAVRDMNCERIKLAKTLHNMGMRVAAVAVMCQDPRVFEAMMDAGTPCPVNGLIGAEAKTYWENNPDKVPSMEEEFKDVKSTPSTPSYNDDDYDFDDDY